MDMLRQGILPAKIGKIYGSDMIVMEMYWRRAQNGYEANQM